MNQNEGGGNIQGMLDFMVLDNENLVSTLWGFVNFYLETLKYRLELYCFAVLWQRWGHNMI